MTRRSAAWLAWASFAVSATTIVASSAVSVLDGGWVGASVAFSALSIAAFPLMGALIASRRPENAIGWLFCGIGVVWGLAALTGAYSTFALLRPDALIGGGVAAWAQRWIWAPGVTLVLTFLLLLYPDGHLPSKRWRPVAWLAGLAIVAQVVPIAVASWSLPGRFLMRVGEDAPPGSPSAFEVAFAVQVVSILVVFALGIASAGSLVARYRRARDEQRAQIKWFAFAGVTVVVAVILSSPLFNIGGDWLFAVVFLIPGAAAIAILKYRLYDIDIVINKAVVVGVLVAFITVVYGGIVVGVGTAVGNAGSPILSAVAAGVVAIAFQPVRHHAQRLANRLVYGRRATPYEVLSDLSEKVGASYATDDILPRMARILAEATGASRAEVWLREGRLLRTRGTWPAEAGAEESVPLSGDEIPRLEGRSVAVPVRHQGELLGALTLEKPPNDPLTAAEERLVSDLASQAGLVLRNAALIEDLRSSRQRLVAAQDEERRRLERNLHDGAQQQLVALAVKLRLLETLIPKDTSAAVAMTRDVGSDVGDALENLRDLARGIYPPLLADKGLRAALEAQARKAPIPVTVDADGIGRYPQDVEAAIYFSCLEALQNVAKYAGASTVSVRLRADPELAFEVRDDGRGFDPAVTQMGTGLQGIADRLAAIGGTFHVTSSPGAGTTLTGHVPAPRSR